MNRRKMGNPGSMSVVSRMLRHVAVLMVATVAFPVAVHAAPAPRAVIGLSVDTLSFAPLIVADELDLFKKAGVDVEVVLLQGGSEAAQALVGGSVDFVAHESAATLVPRARGIDLVAVHANVSRMTMEMVMRQDVAGRLGMRRELPIQQRLALLKGLRIGITGAGAATEVYTRYYLRLGNLDPDRDATLVSVGGGPVMVAALQRGQIDAFQLSPPWPELVEARGLGTVVISSVRGDVPGLDDYPYEVMVARRETLEKRPELVRAVVGAVSAGNNLILDRPDVALQALQKHFKQVDPVVLKAAFDGVREAVPRNGKMTQQGWDNVLRIMKETGLFQGDLDVGEGVAWTNQFTPNQ